jgi:hypothetical protein
VRPTTRVRYADGSGSATSTGSCSPRGLELGLPFFAEGSAPAAA